MFALQSSMNNPRKMGARAAICFLAALLSFRATAAENAYDMVGKALVPLAQVLVGSESAKNKALTAQLMLEQATGLPAEEAGRTVDIQLQSPDKIVVRGKVLGEAVTICRDGRQIWAYPGSKIDMLADLRELPKADPDFALEPLHLPITDQQLVFLPALFKVRDAGEEVVGGVNCRVLDLVLMPELARALKAQDWSARLWVRPDYRPARVELIYRQMHAVISIKRLDYSPSLPPETWRPLPTEAQDVLVLTPSRYKQLIDAARESFTNIRLPK